MLQQPYKYESKATVFFELKSSIVKRLHLVYKLLDNHYNVKRNKFSKYDTSKMLKEVSEHIRVMKAEWDRMNVILPKSKFTNMELNLKMMLKKLHDDIQSVNDEYTRILGGYNSDSALQDMTKNNSQMHNESWVITKKNNGNVPLSHSQQSQLKSILRCSKSANNVETRKKVTFSERVVHKNSLFSLERPSDTKELPSEPNELCSDIFGFSTKLSFKTWKDDIRSTKLPQSQEKEHSNINTLCMENTNITFKRYKP